VPPGGHIPDIGVSTKYHGNWIISCDVYGLDLYLNIYYFDSLTFT
jgi:hypothetical protein